MAAQRRRVLPQRQRGATDWGRLIDPHTAVASGTKVLLFTFVLSNPGISETVRRTRGFLSVISDQSAVMQQQNGAFGMMVVTDLAVAAGVASIPGPVTDASDEGWFVWMGISQMTGSTIGGNVTHSVLPSYPFDSKAMRKVSEGFAIVGVFEALSQGTEVGVAVSLLSSRT